MALCRVSEKPKTIEIHLLIGNISEMCISIRLQAENHTVAEMSLFSLNIFFIFYE